MIEDLEDDIEKGKAVDLIANLKALWIENEGDHYYPVRNLYITCKAFEWMNRLEYIYIQKDYYYDISICNINGQFHGMRYISTNQKIISYIKYHYGTIIDQNVSYLNTFNLYRKINGIDYKGENCMRWMRQCSQTCQNCIELDKIQKKNI